MRSFIVLNYSRAFADADVSSTLLTNGILWVYSTFYKRYFLSPTARKKDVVVVFFKRAFSKTLFVSLSLFLSRSLSLSTPTLSLQSIVPRGRLFFEKLFGIFVFGKTAFDFFFRKLDMFRLAVGFEFASVRERFAVG